MRISVERRDIKDATTGDCYNCPVARSLRRHGFTEPYVGDRTAISVNFQSFDLSRAVTKRIMQFDATGKMAPFTFIARTQEKMPCAL